MCNEKQAAEAKSLEAMMEDARRWAAVRDNGWTLYEVQQEVRVANTTGHGPTYSKKVRRVGWTVSCLTDEEFATADEAVDEARRRLAILRGEQPPAPALPAAPAAPAVRQYPLHEDRIAELADEFQQELLHCGLESFTLGRMIRHALSASDDEARRYAEENGGWPLAALPVKSEAVDALARHYQGELLSNGVETYYLKQMIRDALALAYPRTAAKIAAKAADVTDDDEHYVERGRIAARAGQTLSDCPYLLDSVWGRLWLQGFNEERAR